MGSAGLHGCWNPVISLHSILVSCDPRGEKKGRKSADEKFHA